MMEQTASRLPRLRVLHIIVSLGPANGQYHQHCLPLAREQEITICSFFKASLVPLPTIALFEGDGTLRGFWRSFRRAMGRGPYDIVHAHSPQSCAFLVLTSLLIRRLRRNAVCTVRNSFQSYGLRNRLLLCLSLPFFPKVVVCSNAALQSMPRILRWLVREKVTVVQNAVDTEGVRRVLASADLRRGNGSFTVAWVGRMVDIKNPMTLLEAFKECSNSRSRLVYVGEGVLRSRLGKETSRLGLESRVSFTGLVDRSEVYRQIAQADVLVSTSRGEGLPVAVLEAMACGRPVILSDIEPHREIVGDNDLIPLVKPDDVHAFARELEVMMRMPPEERLELGSRCQARVEGAFSLQAMHRSYQAIYDDITQSSGERG
jgi:glycosyltransferase involved in cell wall biosynthesis